MMNDNPLKIIATDKKREKISTRSTLSNRQQEAQAKYEREWLQDPQQFDPKRNCFERERIDRTYQLIANHIELSGKKAVDFGCGNGTLAKRLRDAQAEVVAVDIAENALKELRKEKAENIETKRYALPITPLVDDTYDLVVCADVIAEIPSQDHRLALSELSRTVKRDGWVVTSTAIDIYSEDALEQFVALNETELQIVDSASSYHAWSIRLIDFLKIPHKYNQGRTNKEFRKEELKRRSGISKRWFQIQSSFPLVYFWKGIDFLLKPIYRWMSQSKLFMSTLESCCQLLKNDRGISHIILIGKRKALVEKIAEPDPQALMHDRPPFRRERKWE